MLSPEVQASSPRPPQPSARLAPVLEAYRQSRFRDALDAGRTLGELRAWPGVEGALLASRVAERLGAPRLAQALRRVTVSKAPTDPDALYFYALVVYRRRGAWHLLRWCAARRDHLRGSARHADWLALEARALADLRDFEQAEARLAEARALAPTSAWVRVETSVVLERADRVAEALETLDGALADEPTFRPALHARAHVLGELGRLEEAHAAFDGVDLSQSFELLSHRAQIARALHRFEAAAEDLAQAHEAAALAEPHVASSLALARADALYLLGRHAEAEESARRGRGPFAERFAGALAELVRTGQSAERVELREVPHIRQHHLTCAPASIAQVTAYLGDPVDHLELAETICFAGTPPHRQRAWAEARGYVVRELDLSLDAAKALLDARLPFVLSTAATASAHAQVVIGYDLTRRGLMIRDPSQHGDVELNVDVLLASQRWYGPHAMVLIPADRAAEVDDARLPNATLLDHRYALDRAIEAHDRAGVDAALAALERAADVDDAVAASLRGEAPTDPLVAGRVRHVLDARLARALYLERPAEQLEALDALLVLYPETPTWLLRRGEVMRALRPQAERLAYWHAHRDVDDPVFLEAIAEELRFEPERRAEAGRLLRRALRFAPYSGMAHHIYADWLVAESPDPEVALESYRFATCLDDASEHFAAAYYDHARSCGREDEALALLERRAQAAGAKAIGPALSLLRAYSDRGHPERGVALLEKLAEQRADDGTLLSALATACLEAGDVGAARRWLDRGAGRIGHLPTRALAEARVAIVEGRLEAAGEALERARAVAPDRVDLVALQASVARTRGGPAAAIAVLEEAYAVRPELPGLFLELCAHLRGFDDERACALLEARLASHPEDAWSRRELSLVLEALDRRAEGIALGRETVARWPHDAYAWSILGSLLAHEGGAHVEEARAALRRAIELDVDNASAISELVACTADPEVTRVDARFVLDALEQRTSAGMGLLAAARAASVLPHAERTARLEQLLTRSGHRPDAWEALVQARLQGGELAEARALAEDACERFPRWISLRHLHSLVARAQNDDAVAERSARETLALAPGYVPAAKLLTRMLSERGRFDEALAVVDAALERRPQRAELHAARAAVLVARGDLGGALDAVLPYVEELDDAIVERACQWAQRLGREDDVLDAARTLGGRARGAWPLLRVAFVCAVLGREDERLQALRDAVAREPRHEPALDFLAEALVERGQHDEALALCPPAAWVGPVPVPMRGRRAWVLHAKGDLDGAVAAMESVLLDDPSYEWGRRQLCDWLEHAGRQADFLRHARLMAEHVPMSAQSHAYLGDALLRGADFVGASAAFARAWSLDPSYVYVAQRVVELVERHQAREAADEAARLFARSEHALPASEAAPLGLRIALAREDESVLARLDVLLATSLPNAALEPAFAALLRSPYAEETVRRVEEALARPETPEAVGWAWTAAYEELHPRRTLPRLLGRGAALRDAGRAAVGAGIERLGTERRRFATCWLWLRHRAWIAAHDVTWAALGYTLFTLGWYRLTARWLGDWSKRPKARPVHLANLVMALFALGRFDRAAAVSARVRELSPDGTLSLLQVFDALGRVFTRDFRGAAEILDRVQTRDAFEAGVAAMARMVVVAQAKAHADVVEVASAVRWSFQTAVRFEHDPTLGEAYRRAFAALLTTRPLAERGELARNLLQR